jgi:hypothetical protein
MQKMRDIRLGLPTVLMLLAVVGAGAFAAGSAMPTAATSTIVPAPQPRVASDDPVDQGDMLPPDHPPVGSDMNGMDLPAGHPPLDPMAAGSTGGPVESPAADESSLSWTAPPRWQKVPNPSSMRLATYRVPRAAGDPADAELSVTQAGGSADANAQRWIGQFDADGQKTAKRTTRKVGNLDVTVVEVQGTYAGGMGKEGAQTGWALLGAIVSTPGMPHFFKLTGPAKSVLAARGEFDAMIGTLAPR